MPGRLSILIAAAAIAGRAPAPPCEPHWSNEFPAAELDWSVLGLAVFDDGLGTGPAVYAGGLFDSADGVTLNRVAKLGVDGWSPLGTGLNGTVWDLMVHDDGSGCGPCLFATGSFRMAGGVVANRVARWDGSAWSALGDGLDGLDGSAAWAWALAEFDDGSGDGPALYVGGYFGVAGEVAANHIAKWDGAAWSSLGDGMDAHVRALHVFDDGSGPALYAGGGFTSAGGVPADYIARWDGMSWSPVGGGLAGGVGALTVFDDGLGGGPALYASGASSTTEGVVAHRIYRWDGVAWAPVGGEFDGSINALSVFDDGSGAALHVGGWFTVVGGVDASRVAKWDGVSWTPLGQGTTNAVEAFVSFDDGDGEPVLYTGGWFYAAGGTVADYCATWDGTQWSSVGSGFQGSDPRVRALLAVDDLVGAGPVLYAAGRFTSAGGIAADGIAGWDGQNWFRLGEGIGMDDTYPYNNVVHALVVHDDGAGEGPMLYAGGRFSEAGPLEVSNIASWNGARWSSLDTGVQGTVYALAVFDEGTGSGPSLFAAGYVIEAGGIPVNRVARWDGVSWSAVGAGTNGNVLALAVFDDGITGPALYAAGGFTVAGEVDASGIARWDGTSWSSVGAGIDVDGYGIVYALSVYDDGDGAALYAGGAFLTSSGMPVNGLASWNGSSWSSVGGGVIRSWVKSLTVFDDGVDTRSGLYVGGNFELAGGTAANSVARWNGAFWSGLGQGITDEEYVFVEAMATFDDGSGDGPALVVGGIFDTAGGSSSANFGMWVPCRSKNLPVFRVCHYDAASIAGPEHSEYGLARTEARGGNNLGHVVGQYSYGNAYGYVWDGGPDVSTLEPPSGLLNLDPYDINDQGQIIGLGWLAPSHSRGFFYENGEWTIFEPHPGGQSSGATAINNLGQVVGYRHNPDIYYDRGFVWQDGEFVDVYLPGPSTAHPLDINDAGQIVGDGAFIWQNGEGTLLELLPDGDQGRAEAINNRGQVVGRCRVTDPDSGDTTIHAVLWSENQIIDLGIPDEFEHCGAMDINDAGVIVGWCGRPAPYGTEYEGFVWQDGVMTNLNDVIPWDLGLGVIFARAVNDSGQITVEGRNQEARVGLLLTPVARPLGDINGNCRVDVEDLVILLFEWGQSDSPADLDGDGVVGIRDFLLLLANWRV